MRIGPFAYSPVIAIMCAHLVSGCFGDAEHLNPLDPLSPAFDDRGTLSGRTTDRASSGISGMLVSIEPSGQQSVTDSEGNFSFQDLAPATYLVTATGDGFETTSDTAQVLLAGIANETLVLNGLPAVASSALVSTHVSRWWPQEDLFRLDVRADVTDQDGLIDIDSVWMTIPHLDYQRRLPVSGEAGVFEVLIQESELSGQTLHSLLGRELNIFVADQAGSVTGTGPVFLSRIIDTVPVAADPQGLVEVSGTSPTLTWSSILLPFEHTFRVDVFRVDNDVTTLIYTESELPSTSLSADVGIDLAQGSYFWTISVVDLFGNLSRSKEAGFVVP